ncbi:cytochrome P450 [Nocardia sp. NPDC051321]|uniref:cytochrome P450 n=1 Tax=Nocardia sp. NPDC051321 TaxID=3364323 RepID=UPI00378BF3E7
MTTVQDVTFDDRYFQAPAAFVRQLALEGPIHRFTAPHRVTGWMITNYELAKTVLTHPAVIKTPGTMVGLRSNGVPRTLRQRIDQTLGSYMLTHMLATDPPDHDRLRRVAADPFTPRAVTERIPRITDIADKLIDKMDPTQPVDLVSTLGVPLPVQIIAEILGIPARHSARIGRSSHVLGDVLSSGISELNRAAFDFSQIILTSLASRRIRHRDDLLSTLVDETRRGQIRLSETTSTIALLLIAGHETTTSLIANTVLNLLENPAELDRARINPHALEAIIDETLRIDPPQPTATLRLTTEPVTLGGQDIAAGEWVMVSLLAAGHDPSATDNPETFESTRKPRRSLPFGHGIHFCLGAQLARTEARIAITQLLTKYPDIALATDRPSLRWRRSIQFQRLETLPVTLR